MRLRAKLCTPAGGSSEPEQDNTCCAVVVSKLQYSYGESCDVCVWNMSLIQWPWQSDIFYLDLFYLFCVTKMPNIGFIYLKCKRCRNQLSLHVQWIFNINLSIVSFNINDIPVGGVVYTGLLALKMRKIFSFNQSSLVFALCKIVHSILDVCVWVKNFIT